MAWLAVDKNGTEYIYSTKPYRGDEHFYAHGGIEYVQLPKGSIEKLIGKTLTWRNKPVEIR